MKKPIFIIKQGYDHRHKYFKPILAVSLTVMVIFFIIMIVNPEFEDKFNYIWIFFLIIWNFVFLVFYGKGADCIQTFVFPDRLEIKSGSLLRRILIRADNIVNITPKPEVNCIVIYSASWSLGSVGMREWDGWKTYIVSDSDNSSAIAVETTDGNYLIGCDDPVDVAEKLNELYATQIQKQAHTQSGVQHQP